MQAAAARGVRHPYVEAGIDKAGVRALAHALGLEDLAELPAAPCLSSRLATGIRVTPERLRLVHAVERLISRELAPRTVRCRLFHDGVAIQLDPDAPEPHRGRRGGAAAAQASSIWPAPAPCATSPTGWAARSCVPPPMAPDVNFDFQRRERIGLSEAVFCLGKTPEQIAEAIAAAAAHGVATPAHATGARNLQPPAARRAGGARL